MVDSFNDISWYLEVLSQPAISSFVFVATYLLTIIALSILWQFTQTIWSLFTMIIIQNLVIEACDIAIADLRLKAVDEFTNTMQAPLPSSPRGCWRKLQFRRPFTNFE